jgi:hypothetical protein
MATLRWHASSNETALGTVQKQWLSPSPELFILDFQSPGPSSMEDDEMEITRLASIVPVHRDFAVLAWNACNRVFELAEERLVSFYHVCTTLADEGYDLDLFQSSAWEHFNDIDAVRAEIDFLGSEEHDATEGLSYPDDRE